MTGAVLLDAGPLVAYFDDSEDDHAWARSVLDLAPRPLLTCEPVLAEVCYLLRRFPGIPARVLDLVHLGAVQVAFTIGGNALALSELMRKYSDLPMSLADACLVLLAERMEDPVVLTIDSHFRIYRTRGRRVIRTIMPPGV